jgi:hypothetical protein
LNKLKVKQTMPLSATTNPMKKRKRPRLDKQHSQIVIVGCGLAGLSAAISLEQAGFENVVIVERDASLASQKEGYGLTLSYGPKGPLAALGLLEEVAQHDCPSRSHYLFQPDGRILGYFGNAYVKHRGHGQRGNLRVPRKVVRRILHDTLKFTTIQWNSRLVDYTYNSETNQYQLTVQEKGATSSTTTTTTTTFLTADLLVAADGIRSAVLQKIYSSVQLKEGPSLPIEATGGMMTQASSPNPTTTPLRPIGLRYMGVRLILGIAEFSHPLLHERGFYTLDGKHRLFTMPYESNRFAPSKKKNRIMWQLSFRTDHHPQEAPLDAESLRTHVLHTCRSWHSPVLDMMQATPMETIWGT